MKISKKLYLIIFCTIPLYIIFILISDVHVIRINLQTFQWGYLESSILMIFSSQIVRVTRWHLWIKKIIKGIPFRYNFINYLSGLSLMVTPARLGEAIRSIFMKKKYGVSISATAPLVLVERLYEIIGIVILSSISLIFVKFSWAIIVVPIIVIIIIVVITQKKNFFILILKRLGSKKIFSHVIPNVTESIETLHVMIGYKQLIPSSLLSVLAVLLDMIGIYLLIIGLHINVNFPESILIVASAILIGFFSFLPGGLITIEGSFMGLFSLKGVGYSSIVMFMILFRIVSTVFLTLIGMIALRQISKDA